MHKFNVFRCMPNEKIRQAYDKLAYDYDRRTRIGRRIFGVERLRAQLLNNISGRVLDVACGSGANFPFFCKASDVTAIDLSPKMLEVAREKGQYLQLSLALHLMDAEKLNFPDCSFDVAVSALSLCTFSNPIIALYEMARTVKKGGRILLLEHGRSNFRLLSNYQDRIAHNHFEEAGCRLNQQPLELIEEAGLTVVAHKRTFFGVFHAIEIHKK